MSPKERRKPFQGIAGEQSEPAAYIPPAPSKAKRNRSWEKAHNLGAVTYRGIPDELRDDLKQVAIELGVRLDEVARAFLEYGLQAYRSGKLRPAASERPPRRQIKKTLYPESEEE